MKRQNVVKSIFVAGLVAAGACGTNAYSGLVVPGNTGNGTDVATLSISPDSVNVLAVGDVVQLSATARDANGSALQDAPIDWSSQDSSVATVSASGIVTAVGEGDTTVTATSGGVSASAVVSVSNSLTGTP